MLARRLRGQSQAAQALLHPLFDEQVVLQHHPKSAPGDGPRSGRELSEIQRREAKALAGTAEGCRHDELTVTVDDDRVTVQSVTRGELPEGHGLEVPLRLVYRFANDEIVEMDAYLNDVVATQKESLGNALREVVQPAEGNV
jgi:hypothetical protein